MTAPQDGVQAQLGDRVYLGTRLANVHFYGEVSDINTPTGATATMELVGDDAVVTMDALVGPKGNDGQMAPVVRMQYGSSISDPAELPDDLTNTAEDIGKAWWVGNQVYMWDGEGWEVKAMGTPGPAGPVPNISPTIESISWEDQQQGRTSEITVSGTAANPGWHLAIAAPRGPKGENATIRDASDYDDLYEPTTGQVLTWMGTKYGPRDPNPYATRMYTIPEGAFQGTPITIGSKIIISSHEMALQPQDFNLWVTGHMRARGIDLDFDPFQITAEVRVAPANTDPKSGVLVARGFGNASGVMTFQPHASTPGSPGDAISPDDGAYGRFAAATSYTMAVILTTGVLGVFTFEPRDAQLAYQVIPV